MCCTQVLLPKLTLDRLTGVLVSHFLMDLQEAAKAREHQHSNWTASFTSITFERVTGSHTSMPPGHDLEDDEIADIESVEEDAANLEDVGARSSGEASV